MGGTNSGAENFFTVPPNFFVVPPMTGHYRKVQGTVTRTELGRSSLGGGLGAKPPEAIGTM